MEDISVLAAFVAGVASFVSPCIIPLVPVYFASLYGPEILDGKKATGRMPEAIIKEKGIVQISAAETLLPLAQEIIDANPKEAADYRAGKTKVMAFFLGQLMKKTQGQANPKMANEIFQRLLGE